jgi:hypothetical protein
MQKEINVKMGGRFGDFIHSLVFCYYYYKKYNKKTKLFMTRDYPSYSNLPRIAQTTITLEHGDQFLMGAENTYKSLYNLISEQPYISSFELYDNQQVDYNSNLFRTSLWQNKVGWTDLFMNTLAPEITERYTNIKLIQVSNRLNDYTDCIVIHRKPNYIVNGVEIDTFDANSESLYTKITKKHKCIFLTQTHDVHLYEKFPLNNKIELITANTLEEVFLILSSAKYYIGNTTGISAIAHAVNTPRLLELSPYFVDTQHYIGETLYYNNLSYIIDTINYIAVDSIIYNIFK